MKNMLLILLVLALVAVFAHTSYAQCGLSRGKAASKGGVCNTTCPVMGGEIAKDTPYTAEYKGKTIGFCCAGCVEAFKADPEKYTAKLGLEKCGFKKS